MKTEYLHYFCVASRAKSFSKAAEELHISQQGLSRVIKILEAEYGCLLFRRENWQVQLTQAGHMLRTLAESVLDAYEHLERVMDGQGLAPQADFVAEKITISMTLNTMHNFYPFFATALSASFPTVRFSVREVDPANLHEMVRQDHDGNDLFFVSIPEFRLQQFASDGEMRFRPLLDTELDCIVGRNSALAAISSFDWKDVGQYELVLKKDPGMIELLQHKGAIHSTSDFEYWSTDSKFLEAVLDTQDAVSFSTSFLGLYPELDSFLHIPIDDAVKTPVGFLMKSSDGLSAIAWAVINFVEQFFSMNYPKGLFSSEEKVAGVWMPVRWNEGDGE